jgi:hypothetical protein
VKVVGPYIRKTVVVPEHTVEVFDEGAYWQLNWQGEPDEEGSVFYAKVAYPTIAAAQRQHVLEATAAERKGYKQPYRRRTRA